MKSFIAFLSISLLVIVIAEDEADKERQEFLRRIVAECSEEIGLELEQANQLLLGDFRINTPEAKCFVNCFFIKEGFMNKNGKPNKEFIIDFLDGSVPIKRHALKHMVERCTEFKSDDNCENSFSLLECFTRAAAEVGEL